MPLPIGSSKEFKYGHAEDNVCKKSRDMITFALVSSVRRLTALENVKKVSTCQILPEYTYANSSGLESTAIALLGL